MALSLSNFGGRGNGVFKMHGAALLKRHTECGEALKPTGL
jgi:hypothetical protein